MPKNTFSLNEIYQKLDGQLDEFECIKHLMFTKQYPGCLGKMPKTWDPRYVSARESKYVADDVFWNKRGLAIHEVEGNAERLALNLTLATRQKALRLTVKENASSTLTSENVLESLAVNDQGMVDRIYLMSSYPKTRDPYYPYRSLLANAVRAAVQSGMSALQRVLKERPKKSPESYEQGIWEALSGIGTANRKLFEQGVLNTAKEERGVFSRDPDDEIRQGIKAGGLIRLASKVCPEVLEGFNWRKLPAWYRSLFDWTSNNSTSLSKLDLKPLSIDLHKVWIELAQPHWSTFAPKRQNSAKQPPRMFGISTEHWKTLCETAPHRVDAAVREVQFQQWLCKCYKIPYRDPEYFGQLIPNLSEEVLDVIAQAECKQLKNARRFEDKYDYYIVNAHRRYLLVHCAALGALGQEHLDQHDTVEKAQAAADAMIQWLLKKGFKEVVMATPEFELAAKLSKQNKAIPIGFSRVDSKKFDKEFEEHWQRKMASREKVKAVRPPARLKASAQAPTAKAVSAVAPLKTKAGPKKPAGKSTSAVSAPNRGTKTKSKTIAIKSATPSTAKKSPQKKTGQAKSGSRRFEFTEGTSSKFWEVSRDGKSVTTKWGRIGTDGQSKQKTFPSEEKSQLEYDKLVDEKTAKGYVEV